MAVAKVADLNHAVRCEQQVLRFEVEVRHAHVVHVLNPAHHLLEEAVSLLNLQFACRTDERVQVATIAELHHTAVGTFLAWEEIDCADYVRVTQGTRDTKLGNQPLAMAHFRFFAPPAELLDRIQLLARPILHLLVRNTNGAERTVARSEEHTSELQSQSNLVCRLLLEKKK